MMSFNRNFRINNECFLTLLIYYNILLPYFNTNQDTNKWKASTIRVPTPPQSSHLRSIIDGNIFKKIMVTN